MRIKTLLFYIVLTIRTVFFADAQLLKFDHLDIKSGLSQNSVIAMEFDELGYLWVGTLNGLNRYDGYNFKTFKPQETSDLSVSGSEIGALCPGKCGDMWVVNRSGGIDRYVFDKGIFVNYGDSILQSQELIDFLDVKYDSAGVLWLLFKYRIVAFNLETNQNQIYESKAYIKGIAKSGKTGVYFFGDFGLSYLNLEASGSFIKKELISRPVYGVVDAPDSLIVIDGQSVSICDYDCLTGRELIENHNLKLDNVKKTKALYTNKELWLADDLGIYVHTFSENKKTVQKIDFEFANLNSFMGHGVTLMRSDVAGNVWIGTVKHGVNVFGRAKNKFKYINWDYSEDINKITEPVRAICKSRTGDIWVGFDKEGVGVIKPDGRQFYIGTYYDRTGEEKSIGIVREIFEDKNNNIWIGFNKGVGIYNYSEGKVKSLDNIIPGAGQYNCYVIEQYDSEKFIISAKDKLEIIDLKNNSFNTIEIETPGVLVRDIEIDDDKNIWVATDALGIVFVNARTMEITHFSKSDIGLSSNKIYSLKGVGENLWLATNSGLVKFNIKLKKVEKTYYEEHGLSNNIVYCIDYDAENTLWMSTNLGLTQLDLLTQTFSIHLKDNVFMDDAFARDHDGAFYFGGYSGIVSFMSKDIRNNENFSLPCFEQFAISGQPVYKGDTILGKVILDDNVNDVENITLSYRQNTFSFKVNAFPFSVPNANAFRYKLYPWNTNWQYKMLADRDISFVNVAPGTYVFMLQVIDESNTWSKTKSVKLTIKSPIWKTTGFRLGGFILLLGLAYLFYYFKIRQIKKRNAWLTRKVDEQTQSLREKNKEIKNIANKLHDADQAKLRFFTNISHEFKTPLTIILGYLEELERENTTRIRTIIKNNALRLLRLINQLIEFRKIDLNQIEIKNVTIEVNGFIKNIVSSFEVLAKQKNIKLETNLDENVTISIDDDKLEKVISNLISNAIKYAPNNSSVLICLQNNADNILIEIIDSGIGLTEDEVKHIFERFYRADNAAKFDGTGIGLSFVKELVQLMEGEITVHSTLKEGTCFSLSFNKKAVSNNLVSEKEQDLIINDDEALKLPLVTEKFKNSNVLIVEDNIDLNAFIKNILSNYCNVITAYNGKEALELMQDNLPDLIISDIMMPEMDGFEFCKKVKQNLLTSHIPFVLLTAKTNVPSKLKGFNLGIDDYIEKPFSKAVFLARVAALLKNREKIKKHLIELKASEAFDRTKISKKDQEFWNSLNRIIKNNISDSEFTTEQLSERMNMSRSTFYRKFKGLTGENVTDYIRKVKLQKAAELISEKKLSLQQISREVGFASISQFRIRFKEVYGKNPSEF